MADTRNSLGWLGLQIAERQRQNDLQQQNQINQERREDNRHGAEQAVALTQHAIDYHNQAEERKLKLADLLSKQADTNASRERMNAATIESKRPLNEAKVGTEGSKKSLNEERTKDIGVNNAMAERKQKEVERSGQVKEAQGAYNAETNRGKLPFMGPFGGMNVKMGPNGLPEGTPQAPGSAETAIASQSAETASAPQTTETPTEAPQSATSVESASPAPIAEIPRVREAPIRPEAYSKAQKAFKDEMELDRLYEKADEAIRGLKEKHPSVFGTKAEGFNLIPKRIPIVGGVGIPGMNFLKKQMVNWSPEDNANAEPGAPGNAARQEVADVSAARARLQDLVQALQIPRQGTTVTEKQQERIDKLAGIVNDLELSNDPNVTLQVLAEGRKTLAKNRREYQYMIEHRAMPLEELPEPVGVTGPAPNQIQIQSGAETPVSREQKSSSNQMQDMINRASAKQFIRANPNAKQMYEMLLKEGVDENEALNQVHQYLRQQQQSAAEAPRHLPF